MGTGIVWLMGNWESLMKRVSTTDLLDCGSDAMWHRTDDLRTWSGCCNIVGSITWISRDAEQPINIRFGEGRSRLGEYSWSN